LRIASRRTGWDGTGGQCAAKAPRSRARPNQALVADVSRRRLWQGVAALPSGERAAVMLYCRDEMAVGDIAGALGVTTGTIKTLLFRARRHLRERLGPSTILREDIST
jgi:RNA polymerase sigma factor (sigma-70 family)